MWSANSSWPTVWAGTTYWNGAEVDGAVYQVPAGAYSFEWTAGQGAGHFGNFFNDRAGRVRGDGVEGGVGDGGRRRRA